MKINKKGFTLLELLIVVLIIGILAAIALPKYFAVVAKSRITKVVNLVKSVCDDQEFYVVANGSYAAGFEDLSTGMPGGGTISTYDPGDYGMSGNKFSASGYEVYIEREDVIGHATLAGSFVIGYEKRKSGMFCPDSKPCTLCIAKTGSDIGRQACESFGGDLADEGEDDGFDRYTMPL